MFRKKTSEPAPVVNNATVDFPNGTVVETTSGKFYYLKNDVKIPIISPVILASWRVVNVPLFEDEALKHYLTAGTLKFRDGTVIYYLDKNYVASEGKLREITDSRWYQWLNINDNDIIVVSKEIFELHKLGEPLS